MTRRNFGMLLAGAAGAITTAQPALAGGGGGPYGSTQGICDTLWQLKQLACGLADLVYGEDGPLSDPELIAEVTNSVLCQAMLGQKLLGDPDSLLFTPPDAWLFWMPLDTFGWTLTQTATEACQRACDRYDAWCSGNTQGVAQQVWLAQGLYCRIFETAGIT